MRSMNRAGKVVAAAVSAVLSLTALAACGSGDAKDATASLPDPTYKVSASTPAWKSDTSKDNTLTWYVNADWWNKSFGKDMITAQIKKDLNLDITFVTGDDTKLNTYFASGKLPDIITTFDSTSKVSQTANQWALPLEELAKKYDPYFSKVAKKETLDWYRLKDGKVYGYPSYSNTTADYKSGMIHPTSAFIVRKDVMNAIGQQDFTTPEGFVKGMQAIKEKFPNLTPFGFNDFTDNNSSLQSTVQDMLGVPITTKSDGYYDRDLDADYVKWLEAFREVHAAGNISDDSFADDADTFKEKVSTGQYGAIMMQNFVSTGTQLQTFASKNPDSAYEAVDGISSTEGREPTLSQSGLSGWSINYITKQTKNPAKAIQVFEYLLSDYGQMLTNFGIEGQTYTKSADGTVTWTEQANQVRLNETEKWQKEYRMGEFVLFGHDRYKALNKASYVDAVWQMQDWGQKYLTPQFKIENIAPDTGSAEARSLSAIQTNWSTTMVGMIRAGSQSDFDGILKKYKQFQKDNNIEQVNTIRSEKIKTNVKKLTD
ncbi:type 2 periplasmic-binding domain-containing protein [Bifidobacterium crudilactis]|uniref:sugar ABC transporter substrate-binding protein n=1 Tax=Bifidobacterium crudilactis TaxID=327277 RepID=UPI000B13C600|nr:sugar ABC transporter substrate-binding protein [Bifidobacterium crudilactis]